MEKKEIRRCANTVASSLILYTLLRYLVFALEPYCRKLYVHLRESDPAARQQLLEQLEANAYASGVSSIIINVLGVAMLLLLFRRTLPPRQLFHRTQKMTWRAFPFLLCVFLAGQLVYSLAANGLELLLQLCGLTAMGQMTAASAQSGTLSMLLYSSFFAPLPKN